MNFLALTQRLHSESMRSTAAPTSVVGASDRNDRLFNAIADAWRDLQSERDWRWMRVTLDVALTVGQQSYTGTELLANRFGRWRAASCDYWPTLYISGSPNSLWDLRFEQLDAFRRQWVYRDMGNSTPVAWSVDEGNKFLVGPKPSVAYMLRKDYWMEPSELLADANEPDMPTRFHLILMWRALMGVAESDAKPELFSRAQTNYAILHDRLLADQARRPHL